MGRQNERTGPLRCGHLGGLFLSVGRGHLGDLAATGDYRKSPTTPLLENSEEQSHMRRSLSTKSGGFQ